MGTQSEATFAGITDSSFQDDPIRVLVVTGGHEYDTSFYTVFERNDAFRWDHAVSNEEAFKSDIRDKYDVLVLYDLSRSLSEVGRENLQNFVESGKGLVVLHHAIANYNDWPWWYQQVMGGRYLLEPDGDEPGSTYSQNEKVAVRAVSDHPVTEGIDGTEFLEETYKGLWISPNVKVLLETDNPASDGPLVWISPYDRSRVIYIQSGHDRPTLSHPAYHRLVQNAILWTAE
jgi:type 1 glutamine amidotransferase